MALDCLFDAYLERDFLDVTMRPNAGFYEKVQLVRKRLGDELVPDVLIKKVVADPRDDAQHDRKPPSIDEVVTAIQAARTVVGAMRAASDPLTGHAVAGALGAYHQTLPSGERRPVFYGFPPVFGLIWRGADGKVRAGVGTAGTGDNRHIAEVQYAPFENFDEQQRLDLLRCFDESATHSGWTQNEEHLRELMVAARLDQP
jgi:hypothetical protein